MAARKMEDLQSIITLRRTVQKLTPNAPIAKLLNRGNGRSEERRVGKEC